MHLMLPPGPAMRDGAHSGGKLCSEALKLGQGSYIGVFSLCWPDLGLDINSLAPGRFQFNFR